MKNIGMECNSDFFVFKSWINCDKLSFPIKYLSCLYDIVSHIKQGITQGFELVLVKDLKVQSNPIFFYWFVEKYALCQ